jgi:hypothetical protein
MTAGFRDPIISFLELVFHMGFKFVMTLQTQRYSQCLRDVRFISRPYFESGGGGGIRDGSFACSV